MHTKGLFHVTVAFVLVLFAVDLAGAQTGSGASIKDFRLVAEKSGWLLASNRLFWSDTLGSQWTEITPATTSALEGVFFAPDGSGWVVESSAHSLAIAHTTDKGAHWSTQPVPSPFSEANVANGRASTFFVDSQHGFIMLELQSGSAFRPGILLRTSDGGSTWTQEPPPPAGGEITFLDARHGFMGPGPEGDELYSTSDGGDTWQRAGLPAPAAFSGVNSTIALPVFTDAFHGVLLRTFSTDAGPVIVRYETTDAGATWAASTTLNAAQSASLAIARDGSITASSSAADLSPEISGRKLTPGLSSFSTSADGWVNFKSGDCSLGVCAQSSSLRGTLDGGKTYFSLSQIPGINLEPTVSFAAASPSAAPVNPDPLSSSVYNTAGVMGFDACSLPTLSQMSSWIAASPYREAGIYIGGANFACKSGLSSLTSSYVSTITGEGWQMIPIWVGLQAPGSSCSSCSMMSTTTATANSQGVTEADSAVAAMAALGLNQGSTIVYDMEAYSYSSTTDTAATQAFIEGWVTELHSKGYIAAVYSSNPEFVNWYPGTVTPAIDIIYFAYFFSNDVACGTECQTVFPTQGSFPISASYWLNNHRARQTSSSFNSTYGGVTINIDEDWVDAPMVTATPNTLTLSKTTGGSVASSTITNTNGDTSVYTGISCGTTCTTASATFAPTDTIALVATPSAGLSVSWKGCTSVSGSTCTVTVASSETVVASFGYPLTVTATGAGTGTVTSADGGINCGSSCSFDYPTGTTITLTAAASANSYFTGWTGCTTISGNTCTVVMGTAAVTVQPAFSTGTTLTVSATGTGTGTITSSDGKINCGTACSATYAPSTVVTLTAAATGNSTFGSWTGCTSTSGATCTITLGTSAATVTASFLPPATLTVTATTGGTVVSAPAGINCGTTCSAGYAPNTVITLTETPSTGYVFTAWSSNCTVASATTCTITATGTPTVTATFAPAPTFTGALTTTSLTVAPGASGTDTLNFQTANGWTGAFSSFACTGQPATVTCTFNPTSVTATTNTTYPVTITVSVPASLAGVRSSTPSNIVLATLLLPGMVLSFAFRRRFRAIRTQRLFLLAIGIAALAAAQTLMGCGGSSSTPATSSGPIFNATMTVSYTSTSTGGSPTTSTLPVTLTIP